eukprot:4323943-Ditylum_brightwellii.AAC.1
MDLLMDEHNACNGVVALNMENGTIHPICTKNTVLVTGRYNHTYFFRASLHACTGDGNTMALRSSISNQDAELSHNGRMP